MNIKKNARNLSAGFAVLALLFSSAGVYAQGVTVADPSSIMGPIAAGQGSASIAGSMRHDSLILNPAAATGESLYSLAANYGATGDLMSASIVDTKSGPVGGGAYYMRRNTSALSPGGFLGNYERSEEQAGLSLMGHVSESVGIGITGRYIKSKLSGLNSGSRADWDGDVGLRWTASTELSFALVARSLLKEKSGLSPAQYSAGVAFTAYPGLILSASATKTNLNTVGVTYDVDVPVPTEKFSYAAGAEWITVAGVGFRAGYSMLRPWGQNIASAGLVYQNKGFAANYSFSQATEGAEYTQHLMGLSFEL